MRRHLLLGGCQSGGTQPGLWGAGRGRLPATRARPPPQCLWFRRTLRAAWALGACRTIPPAGCPWRLSCLPRGAPSPVRPLQLTDECLAALTEEFKLDSAPIGVLGTRFLAECAVVNSDRDGAGAASPSPAPAPAPAMDM